MTSFFSKKLFIFLNIMLMLVCSGAVSYGLSLQEAKEEALKANLDIKISREKFSEAQFIRKESFTNLFPEFSMNSLGSYVDKSSSLFIEKGAYGTYPFGPIPLNDSVIPMSEKGTYRLGLKIQQPVFAGGRIYFSYRQAKSEEVEALWKEQQTIQDVLFTVETAYYDLLKAEEMRKLSEQHEDTLKTHLADMEQLYQKGRAAFVDVLNVRVKVSRASEDVLKTNNDVAIAKVHLNLIMNRPLDQTLDVVPLGNPKVLSIGVQDAESQAKSRNKALNSARAKKMTALFQRRVAEADYYPNIALTGEYFNQNRQPTSPEEQWSVMLKMNWSLWHWGETQHKVNAVRAFERQMEYTVASLENQIAATVRDNFYRIQESDKCIEVAKDAMAQAQENLRITHIGFDNGRKTSTEVLDAEDLLSKVSFDYLQAFYDAHAARAHLRYVMGAMEAEDFSDMRLSVSTPLRDEKPDF